MWPSEVHQHVARRVRVARLPCDRAVYTLAREILANYIDQYLARLTRGSARAHPRRSSCSPPQRPGACLHAAPSPVPRPAAPMARFERHMLRARASPRSTHARRASRAMRSGTLGRPAWPPLASPSPCPPHGRPPSRCLRSTPRSSGQRACLPARDRRPAEHGRSAALHAAAPSNCCAEQAPICAWQKSFASSPIPSNSCRSGPPFKDDPMI